MPSTFEFCLPTKATTVPSGPDWLHEVKYDGYRVRLERDADRVRLITRGGYDWTGRYPWIVESALKNRHRQFVIDGEAVVLGAYRSPHASLPHRRDRQRQLPLQSERRGDKRTKGEAEKLDPNLTIKP